MEHSQNRSNIGNSVFCFAYIIAFHKNTDLKQFIGCNKIVSNQRKTSHIIQSKRKGSRCRAGIKTICCHQIMTTTTFKGKEKNI